MATPEITEAVMCPPPEICPDCDQPNTESHLASVEHSIARSNRRNPQVSFTRQEEKIVREFVEKGRTLDKPIGEILELGIKVKAIFASKPRGVPMLFESRHYTTFDKLVDATFPICGRTMRRWMAKQGLTDQRFANKLKPEPLTPTPLPEPAPAPEPTATEALLIEPMPEPEPKKIVPPSECRTPEQLRKIKLLIGLPTKEQLPRLADKVWETAFACGYDCGYANGYNESLDGDYPHGECEEISSENSDHSVLGTEGDQ
jgi:hypothetical protein